MSRLPWPHLKMIGQLPSRRFCRCGSHGPPGPAHQTCKVDRISARHENCQGLQARRGNIRFLEIFLQISSLTCARLRQPNVSIRGDLLCEAAHSLGAALRITTFGNQHRQVILGKVLNLIINFILPSQSPCTISNTNFPVTSNLLGEGLFVFSFQLSSSLVQVRMPGHVKKGGKQEQDPDPSPWQVPFSHLVEELILLIF